MIYRSIAGPRYDAVIIGVGPRGFVDLNVDIAAKDPWPLKSVRVQRIEAKVKA